MEELLELLDPLPSTDAGESSRTSANNQSPQLNISPSSFTTETSRTEGEAWITGDEEDVHLNNQLGYIFPK
ncbi:unnamed protein product [Peronospora farinosa]|uniref:Uncharacterized protein n=1 Tax=Peronospora farinosa TaxID=134698 RepID=A0ABN8C1A5_9STRA|nr:unnamed protein product [Peronospora farinosa]